MGRALGSLLLVLILAQIATAFVINDTILEDNENKLKDVKTRRKDKSTSSSKESRNAAGKLEGESESLGVVFTNSDSSSVDVVKKATKKQKNRNPKSTVERKGWRKWHRKCTKCPEDMQKKWRDPSIKWICGAYQRARRSFKSLCMMHMRNCQDGTMFTKIADHRCPNSTRDDNVHPYNHHFFYDYKVVLTDETSGSDKDSGTDSTESSSVSESELQKNMPPFRFNQR